MNDRYLYRAKRIDNGEWINGDLITTPFIRNETQENIPYILDITKAYYDCFEELVEGNGIFEVDPFTICQCTGLKKFYEKDIVKRTDIHPVVSPSIGIIEYDVENTAFVIHWIDKQMHSPMYPWKEKIEVCGNIFDNPELLEVEE